VLVLEFADAGDEIVVKSSDGLWDARVMRAPSQFTQQVPAVGRYTGLIAHERRWDAPPGFGFVQMNVTRHGYTTVIGRLADGRPISAGGLLDTHGRLAVSTSTRQWFVQVQGVITFAEIPGDSDCAGSLLWAQYGTARNGWRAFTVRTRLTGSRYNRPAVDERVLDFGTNGRAVLELSDGPFSAPIRSLGIVNPGQIASFAAPISALHIYPWNGLFTGQFIHPADGRPREFSGVVLQKRNIGGGFFIDSQEGGQVLLTPAP
jgi:hypothetical protein